MGCASSQEEAPAQSANASKYAVDAAASKAQHAPSAVDAANKLVAKTDATGSAAEVNGKHVADGAAAAANAVAKVVATNGATPTASPRPGEAAQPAPAPAAPATPAAAAAAAQTGAASAVAAQDTLMKVRHCPRASRRVSHPCYPMVATWRKWNPAQLHAARMRLPTPMHSARAGQRAHAEVCGGAQRAFSAGAGVAQGAGHRGRRLPGQVRMVSRLGRASQACSMERGKR